MMATSTTLFWTIITGLHLVSNSKAAVLALSNESQAEPSRISNYIIQNYEQYNSTVSTLDIYLAEFRKNYFGRIETLQLNEEFLDEEFHKTLRQLSPLDALDDVRNFCVYKYRGNYPELNIIKTNLAICNEKANNAYNSIISAPLTTLRNLRNHYANQFSNEIKACSKKHEQNETLHINCVLTTIKSTNTVTFNNIKLFHNQLKQSLCTATYKIKETFDCHTPIIFNTLSKIAEVNTLVESCVTGSEFCTSTDETVSIRSCPYHLSIHVGDDGVVKADEMQQILKGVGKTAPCLQLNFIRKVLALT